MPMTHPPGCGNSSSCVTSTACSRGAPGTPEPPTSTTSPPTRTTAHPAKPGPTPSPPSAEDTTGRKPSGDGATTAPRPATTNGPDPKARPTWSPRRHHPHPAQLSLDTLDHRHTPITRTHPGDPACPQAAAGPGQRGVLRRRSVKATRGGTPQSNRDRHADREASRRGEPSAADVARRTAPHHPQPTWYAAEPRTTRTTEHDSTAAGQPMALDDEQHVSPTVPAAARRTSARPETARSRRRPGARACRSLPRPSSRHA